MSDFKFIPQVGMKTNDAFLHGATDNDAICKTGQIEVVGRDYFVLRLENDAVYLIEQKSYWVIQPQDFH